MRKAKPNEKALIRNQGYNPKRFLIIKRGADFITLWERNKKIPWEVRI